VPGAAHSFRSHRLLSFKLRSCGCTCTWRRCSGVVQLKTSLDREKQEMYQLRVIAFDKAARPHRSVAMSLLFPL